MMREELNRYLPGDFAARELEPERFADGYRWRISSAYKQDVVGSIDFDVAGNFLKVNSWSRAERQRMLRAIEKAVALKQAFEAGFEAGRSSTMNADADAACIAAWREAWPHLRGSIA